jgi:hypothetical protein
MDSVHSGMVKGLPTYMFLETDMRDLVWAYKGSAYMGTLSALLWWQYSSV